ELARGIADAAADARAADLAGVDGVGLSQRADGGGAARGGKRIARPFDQPGHEQAREVRAHLGHRMAGQALHAILVHQDALDVLLDDRAALEVHTGERYQPRLDPLARQRAIAMRDDEAALQLRAYFIGQYR